MPKKSEFTIIELLLVVGIISILAAILIVVLNPLKQLGSVRDAQRIQDVSTILNAVDQYIVDHEGALPDSIPLNAMAICRSGENDCSNLVDLREPLSPYLDTLPNDPQATDPRSTGYVIVRSEDGSVTVSAPNTEQGEELISETH